MNKKLRSKREAIKYSKESINFSNLIKYWIKLKTVDSNQLNYGLISEKRYQLQKLLFEKSLLALDSEYMILEQKFIYLMGGLDAKNREFTKEVHRGILRLDKDFINDKSLDKEFWMQTIHTNIQHHQTYESIKLNITDLITQWTRVYSELWIYNDQIHYQVWFKQKFEQFKLKMRNYQCTIVFKMMINLFNSMYGLIKSQNFERKDEFLELVQTILIELSIEIDIYLKLKHKTSKTTGYESFSVGIIKRIAYLNSKRCNSNFLNSSHSIISPNLNSPNSTSAYSSLNFRLNSRNSIDLIGRLKENAIDKRKWFANLNDLGLIEVNKKLFEKFTDHSFKSWFQPDDQISSINSSIDQSVDKSVDRIYDRAFDKNFDKVNDKSIDRSSDKLNKFNKATSQTTVIPSKFNELINRQQILNLSYHSLQLISKSPSSKLIDYLEKVYWNHFWTSLNFHIQHSSMKATFQSLVDEDFDLRSKTNQFHRLIENIRSDFIMDKMYLQFYEFKSVDLRRKEEMITKCVSYIRSVYRLCSNQLIKINTETQKTKSFLFILMIEDTFDSLAKVVEKVTYFRELEELIFILINIETINAKIKFIENSINAKRNFIYSNFFNKIQVHLLNRLEKILEYKVCNSINKHYPIKNLETNKPSDWMQKLIDDVFKSILKFKNFNKTQTLVQIRIEQIYICKFNLFLIRIHNTILSNGDKKSIENLKHGIEYYMNWLSLHYDQHLKTDNFPKFFLELLEKNSNLHFESPVDDFSIVNRKSSINRNQIAPQSIYETTQFDSISYTERADFLRRYYFRSDAVEHLKISNKKSFLKMLFCFDTN